MWKSDCISKNIRYGRAVSQCGGLIVYQSMNDIAELCLRVKV